MGMHRRVLALAALLLLGLASGPALAGTPSSAYRVIGYDMGHTPAADLHAAKLDVLNFAFATVADGRVVLSPMAAARLDQLVALRQQHPRLEVVLSIGGWGAGGFSEAAATTDTRAVFVASAVALMREHHADGLDIDWEYPGSSQAGIASSPADRAHFTALIKALRGALDRAGRMDGQRYRLTVATADSFAIQGVDLAALAPYLDWFNVMTYDFNNALTPTTGHQAGLHASRWAPATARTTSRAVRQYLAAGVPAAKIVIGVAFYGRAFDQVKPEHRGRYQPYGKFCCLLSWKQLKHGYINQHGFVRHWDRQAQAPYLWNAATHQFISYDDPQSIAAKAAYVKKRGLGGIMFWEAGLDDDGQLLDAVWKGLRTP